jgi:outer membrane protein TolC
MPAQRLTLADSSLFFTCLPSLPASLDSSTLARHPTLLSYQRRVATSDALAKSLSFNNRPTLFLVGVTWRRGSGAAVTANVDGSYDLDPSLGAGLPFKVYNYAVGAALTWRVTELVHSKRAVTAQLARSEQARAEYSQQELLLRTEQQNARLQLDLARQSALVAPAQLEAVQRACTQAQACYNAGLDNLVVLTQATLVLNRAETDQAIAINNVWQALLLRTATTGSLTELTQQLP